MPRRQLELIGRKADGSVPYLVERFAAEVIPAVREALAKGYR
jgi:hypothetical protein